MTETKRDTGPLSWALVASLYLPALVVHLGQGMVHPVLPLYARSFEIGVAEASLIFVTYQLGGWLFTLPTGLALDKLSRRAVLLGGMGSTALAAFLMAIARTYPELLIYRFLAGAANEMWFQARMTIITATVADNQRARQISWMLGLQRVGQLSGPALGGLLAGALGLWFPFMLHGLMMLPMILLTVMFIGQGVDAKPLAASEGGQPTESKGFWRELRVVLTPQVRWFFLVTVFASLCRGGEGANFNLYAVYEYGVGPTTLGFVSAAAAVVALPIPFMTGYFMDRWGRRKVIMPGFGMLATALLIMAIGAFFKAPFAWFVITFCIVQAVQSTTNGTMQTLGSDMAPRNAIGRFIGVWRTVQHMGSLISPALFAVVAQFAGFGNAFLSMVIAGYLILLIVAVVLKETRPGTVTTPASS